MNDNITIGREEYLRLRLDSELLGFLQGGGVDSWEWYGDSLNPDDGPSYSEVKKRLTKEILG